MLKIRELRNKQSISQKELAMILGVPSNTFNQWENGKREPDYEMLKRIADFFNVSTDYLIGREEKKETSFLNEISDIVPIEKKKIPLLGEIACGKPIYAEEDFEGYVQCGTDIAADFALICKGDSMINARILDGDTVFIRKQSIVEDGEIAAVVIDNEATLKRFYLDRENNTVTLVAENPRYKPLVYKDEELNSIYVLGKAVAFQSEIR